MVDSQSDWADFDRQRNHVAHLTVDKLKQLIVRLNDDCSLNLLRTGKKAELITRIHLAMDSWRRAQSSDVYRKAREVIDEVASVPTASSSRRAPVHPYLPSPAASVPATATYHPYPGQTAYAGPSNASAIYNYNQRPVQQVPNYAPGNPSPASHIKQDIRFSTSPFYRVVEQVSDLGSSPETKDPAERKNIIIQFTLTSSQRERLSMPNSPYQLRLYCTSSTHYSPTPYGRVNPCPIEFPSTCEVRVNSTLLSANLRGLKKKPGTAPPADLGKTVKLQHTGSNKLDMIFMNNQTPFQPKRFYALINLVEVTTVQQNVDRLRNTKYRSRDDILAKMKASNEEDDDIVAGPASMSLKCPMSYVRIKVPCRSKYCVHAQCFDAESWFSVMEQTTTWLCPVCDKTLIIDDLIVDGYFDSILHATPDSVEDVVVEANGDWHSTDNKYGSDGWKAMNQVSEKGQSTTATESKPSVPPDAPSPLAPTEVYVIDSDDEDEGRVKREVSPSLGRTSSDADGLANGRRHRSEGRSNGQDVIDLTLSDDDDSIPPPRRPHKRIARDSSSPPLLPTAKKTKINGETFF